jgi:hypothetical protein
MGNSQKFHRCWSIVAFIFSAPLSAASSTFLRGDANLDDKLDIADPVTVLGYLYLGTASLSCLDAADGNDDGELDIADPIFLLSFLFNGGGAPPAPFPAAGPDPTPDGMECPDDCSSSIMDPPGFLLNPVVKALLDHAGRHPGSHPPDVEGCYQAGGVVDFSEFAGRVSGETVNWRFSFGTPSGGQLKVEMEEPPFGEGEAGVSFIEGEGDLFTVYSVMRSSSADLFGRTCYADLAVIFSGKMNGDGSLSSLSIGVGLLCLSGECGALRSGSILASSNSAGPGATTFQAPQAQAVELLVSRLQINRVVHPGVLDSLLQNISPVLNVVGKLNENLLLLYNGENNSRDLITIDFERNSVKKVLSRDQLLELFMQQAQKPILGPVTRLQNGWLLGFEKTSNALFAIREFPEGSGEIVASLVMDQATIQDQVFPDQGEGPPVTRAVVKAQSLLEFRPNEILLVPATTNITSLHHLEVEEVLVQDEFGGSRPALIGHFVLLPPSGEPPDSLKREGFLEFEKVKVKTGNTGVNFIDFPPLALPGTNLVLLFDQALQTSSFLALSYKLEPLDPADPRSALVYRATVEVLAGRKDLTDAILASNGGGEPFPGQFRFTARFLHPGARLAATDPEYRTQVLAFDSVTTNLLAIDWTAQEGSRAAVFSSAQKLASRIDSRPDQVPQIPESSLLFAQNDVRGNRIAFGGESGDLLSLSYQTGDWVVVLHRAEISRTTGNSLVGFNYLEAPDNDNLRAVDFESATVLGVRLIYEPVSGTCRPLGPP